MYTQGQLHVTSRSVQRHVLGEASGVCSPLVPRRFSGQAGNQHARLSCGADSTHYDCIRLQTPMFGPTHLTHQFQPMSTPALITRKSKSTKNQPVNFLSKQ